MPWPLSDDIDAVIGRLSPPTQPARHWWALPLQIVVIVAVAVAFAAAMKPDPIPVHKDGSIRATQVKP